MNWRKKSELSVAQIRQHARTVLRYRLRLCAQCGYDRYVEVCHIVAIRKFGPDALLHDINAPSNLAFLCPNCHKDLDTGKLAPQESWTWNYSTEDLGE